MKVFLDTNVLASGLATRGLCSDVVRTVFESHDLVICEALLTELKRILKSKFDVPQDAIADALWLLRQDSTVAEERPLQQLSIEDRDDVPIVSAACNGGADVFVTGDKEVLGLVKVGEMRIRSPRQFWEELRDQRSR